MSEFVDQLKLRLVEAQRKVQVTQNQLQQAQQEHQGAMQELQSLQILINIETQRSQVEVDRPQQATTVVALTPTTVVRHTPAPSADAQSARNGAGINKTEVVREALRQHPTGITPAQLWLVVRDRVDRPYVYAVLKRLKDNRQVTERRGKYYLIEKTEEKESPIMQH